VLVKDIMEDHKQNKGRALNAGGADERELEQALKASLEDQKKKEEEEGMVGTVLNRGGGAPGGAKDE